MNNAKFVKELLEWLEKFVEEWRKDNKDIAKPFVLECMINYYYEKIFGIKKKPINRLTIKL